jgi:enoyl-CoA hydratase
VLASPFAAETLSDVDGLVVVASPDGSELQPEHCALLASLPCVVIAVDRPPDAHPAWADLVPEPTVATLDDLVSGIASHPVAATSLVMLLRATHANLGEALVAESAVFSLLQAGPEFRVWRTNNPVAQPVGEPDAPVVVERVGDNLQIVLHRPHVRNALNRAMRDELLNALSLAAADPTIMSVTLRGDGPSFSSGGDLNEFGSFTNPASAHLVRVATSIGRSLNALGDRLTVEVHGPCAGSGVELPAFAHRVVARKDFTATLPEVALGLIPGAGGTASIRARIGRQRTALLAVSGARLNATTALAWGMVDAIIE